MSNNLNDLCNYYCPDCSSLIEIISINETDIEFKYINKKNKYKMKIEDYLNKINNNIKVNNDICNTHNEKYIIFCFNCNYHLCNECLKDRRHRNHNKNLIADINPLKEELDIIKNFINENKNKIKKLNNEKINKENELNKNIYLINKEKEYKIKENKKNEIIKLDLIFEKYKLDIETLKNKYEQDVINRKEEYIRYKNEIKNKYEFINKLLDNI